MEVKFNCPACGQQLLIDERGRGLKIDCPVCNQGFTFPDESLVASPHNSENSPMKQSLLGISVRKNSRFFVAAILILSLVCVLLVATVVILIYFRPNPLPTEVSRSPSHIERQPENISLEGEVFIATRGGGNIKLGLVSVTLVPLDEALDYLEGMRETSIHSITQRKKDIATAKEEFERQVESAKEARLRQRPLDERQLKLVEDQILEHFEKFSEAVRADKDQAKYFKWVEEKSELEKRRDDLTHKIYDEPFLPDHAREQQIKIQALELDLGFSYSGDWWFSKLPSGINSVKTDSNGIFKIQIPSSGNYVIAAKASRQISERTEDYYWLVRIKLPLDSQSKILLSNHNLFSLDDVKLFHGSADSLLSEP